MARSPSTPQISMFRTLGTFEFMQNLSHCLHYSSVLVKAFFVMFVDTEGMLLPQKPCRISCTQPASKDTSHRGKHCTVDGSHVSHQATSLHDGPNGNLHSSCNYVAPKSVGKPCAMILFVVDRKLWSTLQP